MSSNIVISELNKGNAMSHWTPRRPGPRAQRPTMIAVLLTAVSLCGAEEPKPPSGKAFSNITRDSGKDAD